MTPKQVPPLRFCDLGRASDVWFRAVLGPHGDLTQDVLKRQVKVQNEMKTKREKSMAAMAIAKTLTEYSRITGTMVARSSSVRVIALSNLSQFPPLLIHVGSDRLR